MNILDEQIPNEQRQLLKSWRYSVRHIGYDIGRKGMQDDEIIPLLRRLRQPTFFTLDFGFYERQLCHQRYCIVWMDIDEDETASFVRRLLRHAEFDTQAKRMGAVLDLSRRGLKVWRLHAEKEVYLSWIR
ncbi:hypothetical protein TFLX_04219 [Thermoflexales bacterium]|nr:hypothetical protein TFLX_04219 [Thermoflexales bacterium]